MEKKLIILLITITVTFLTKSQVDPDINLNITQVVRRHGYPCTNHKVITEDGYIIQMQHIPHGPNNPLREGEQRPAVYLQHGVVDSSFTWFMCQPYESLGYILADAGFDVWAGNVRGNIYGMEHVHLSPDSDAFWNFSFQEMMIYDFPANTEYILNQTKLSQISYVGHSQGGGMLLGGLSLLPEMQDKFSSIVLLAPASYEEHQSSILLEVLATLDTAEFLEMFGYQDFLPQTWWLKLIADTICAAWPSICENVLFLITGTDPGNLNQTRMPVIINHTPAGTSTKNMMHWSQLVFTNRWQMFDYGKQGNIEMYGVDPPPEFPAERITHPISFYFGGKDSLVTQANWEMLFAKLSPDVDHEVTVIDKYEHMDMLWALDAYKILNPNVVADLKKNQKTN
ncbi:lipase [Anaeramoeba ignava]|uniref:Lipase n=1 Tax=Anaeramoeba ignava TaxID=1746090 RepID=A0A9Q0L617_ANAIG|nr:lipase [Anaeramoeba ignava]|eukprot:Anaeramoba_ignava/c18396_g1_i1.p1 GENE.c18396_g1_i1~~c18396_g1_i1.p1  ORF type:complete len:397 (+),score=93.42 c18396_g1_i1:77-1267(+)